MRRPFVIVLGALLALGAIAVGEVSTASAATTPPKPVTVTITSAACPGHKIYCFKSAALKVTKGTKVVWKNASAAPHTVTRCTVSTCHVSGGTGTDPKLKSPTINPGKTYTFTFHHAGTYVYFCLVHGYTIMHGTITVH